MKDTRKTLKHAIGICLICIGVIIAIIWYVTGDPFLESIVVIFTTIGGLLMAT